MDRKSFYNARVGDSSQIGVIIHKYMGILAVSISLSRNNDDVDHLFRYDRVIITEKQSYRHRVIESLSRGNGVMYGFAYLREANLSSAE